MAKTKHPNLTARSAAARILVSVIDEHHSLNAAFPQYLDQLPIEQRALCQQFCYGVLRQLPLLEKLRAQLLNKPLKRKDHDIAHLLLIGLYQLREMRIPAHAAISETVNATTELSKEWAKGFLNACLRNYQRQQTSLDASLVNYLPAQYAHPQWLIAQYQHDWPDNWQAILQANNTQAPMTLRVNLQKVSRETYLQHLAEHGIAATSLDASDVAIQLEQALDVQLLPGFDEGWVSVQDGSAQKVVSLLELSAGMSILDACAAPGGKTCHILESQPNSQVLALDIDGQRLQRIETSLQRLGLQAKVQCADAADTATWWQGELFDRILIDAPCTGSGVIRRHPDIKVLRRPEDIASLVQRQHALLDALWPLLAPNGLLIYTTCSAFKAENEAQIAAFLARHNDAKDYEPRIAPTRKVSHGYQHLPGDDALDGFYYACLQRHV